MRRIGLVTSSRADWGIQRCVAEALRARNDVQLEIVACGMHLAKTFGHTVDQILADGFDVAHRVDFLEAGDTPEAIGVAMGRGTVEFARLFARWQPDLLTVLGDRFDMFPAAVAALPHLIPLAHLHGGEVTEGAIDDALRHAITKMAHLHLCATEVYAQRVRQLGEPAEFVHVVGAPGLDDLLTLEPLDDATLEREFGFTPDGPNLLVVYHSETRSYTKTPEDVAALLEAVQVFDGPAVVVRPNADTANQVIQTAIDALCATRPRTIAPVHLDRRAFLSLMRRASVMVGNSSSGIIEAPSAGTPVVNVGNRQAGRVRAANIIDCEPTTPAIRAAIAKAVSPAFVKSLAGLCNPFGNGHSAPCIAKILSTVDLSDQMRAKRFVDMRMVPDA